MARVLSSAFCVALLAVTAGAFALTEAAKTELSPIYGTSVAKIFSPTSFQRSNRTAAIDFKLRKGDELSVWMEQAGKRVVTIVSRRSFPKGEVSLAFTGIGDTGSILPDGSYNPVVHLAHRRWTITLPNPILLDTKKPRVVSASEHYPSHISPDGDGHNDVFRVPYVLSEKAHAILLVDHQQVEFVRRQTVTGVLTWYGTVSRRLARPGRHVLEIAAVDTAGNRSEPRTVAVVTIRYIELAKTRIFTKPGKRFSVHVLTDSATVSWLLDDKRQVVHTHTLRLRAPSAPGEYRLYVTAAHHSAKAVVIVR